MVRRNTQWEAKGGKREELSINWAGLEALI